MKNILDGTFRVLREQGVDVTTKMEEALFEELRLVYKRIEGDIIDRKILPLIEQDFTPLN